MVQCAQCMFENEAAASCEQCGADLQVEALSMQLGVVCRSCDSYNDPGVRVCVSCGHGLGAPTEEEPPAETPAEPGGRPWMRPPDPTPAAGSPVLVPTRPSTSTPAVMSAASAPAGPAAASAAASGAESRGAAALPPGALPPGWGGAGAATRPASGAARPAAAAAADTKCGKCASPNPPTARFCGNCGHTMALSSGQSRTRGKLILIRGVAGEGRQFPLMGGATTAGKGDVPVAFPEDPYVSANHATFLFRGDDLVVKDEGAANGVYVRLREPATLRPGDMFVVGERLLRFGGLAAAGNRVPGLHGSPRAAEKLLVLEELLEGGGVGRVCRRAGPVVTIGRAGCDLNFPQDGFVSARHAEISLAGETAFLRDLGSANGSFLRVQPRTERVLHHGDYLLMGRELLRVEVTPAAR